MRNIRALFALAAAISCTPALAQVKAEDVYVGASYGQAYAADAGPCAKLSACVDRPHTLRAFAGYQFHPHLAVEAGYANLGSVRGVGATYVRSSAWDAVLVASWPLMNRLNVFGKLGVTRGAQQGGGLLAAPKVTTSHLTYGIGAQFDLTENLGLRAEWQDYPKMGGGAVLPRADVTTVFLGAVWRFR